MVDEGEDIAHSELTQPASSAFKDFLEVIALATTRPDLVLGCERHKVACITFDE